MFSTPRSLAVIMLATLTLFATGCGGNAKKIVGKWKLVSVTNKDGKEQMADFKGITPVMEFTANGEVRAGVDPNSIPEEFKKKFDKEATAKLTEMQKVGSYKVSGSYVEFTDMKKSDDSPFGKKNRGKLAFEGDNLTITGDDGSVKLTRMK